MNSKFRISKMKNIFCYILKAKFKFIKVKVAKKSLNTLQSCDNDNKP
jgi:hypothetical protein